MIPEEPARAAGPELTAEMVADSATASAPAISPDGHWVAYLVTTASEPAQGPASTLWIAATDGSEPPRPLTAGPAQAPRWTPDADAISYLAGGQLCLIRPDGSGEVTLTSWKPAITAHLPLGPLIAVVARDRELGGDPEVWSEPGRVNRLWQLEPGRAGLEPVAGLGDRHVVEIAARPDGEALAVISWDRPEDEPGAFTARLHIADLSTGQVRDLGPAGLDARSPVWWPAKDGWHVAYLAITPPGPVGGDAIFDVPPEGPHRNLTAGLDVCPAELVQVPGKPPLALFADGLDTAVYQLDPGRGRFRPAADLDRPGRLAHRERFRGADRPPAEHRLPAAGGPRQAAGRVTDPAQRHAAGAARDHLGHPGAALVSRLRRTGPGRPAHPAAGRSRADGPFPLVTLVHGGPYGRYADSLALAWWPSGQWLATAGYAVFLPNPRGSAGHGHEFAVSVAGAVRYAGVDRHSHRDRPAGRRGSGRPGPARYRRVEPRRFHGRLGRGADRPVQGRPHGRGHLRLGHADRVGKTGPARGRPGRRVRLGEHRTAPPRQPARSATARVRTPVLIVHGREDTNVPVGHEMYFHRALGHYGAEHEWPSTRAKGIRSWSGTTRLTCSDDQEVRAVAQPGPVSAARSAAGSQSRPGS